MYTELLPTDTRKSNKILVLIKIFLNTVFKKKKKFPYNLIFHGGVGGSTTEFTAEHSVFGCFIEKQQKTGLDSQFCQRHLLLLVRWEWPAWIPFPARRIGAVQWLRAAHSSPLQLHSVSNYRVSEAGTEPLPKKSHNHRVILTTFFLN